MAKQATKDMSEAKFSAIPADAWNETKAEDGKFRVYESGVTVGPQDGLTLKDQKAVQKYNKVIPLSKAAAVSLLNSLPNDAAWIDVISGAVDAYRRDTISSGIAAQFQSSESKEANINKAVKAMVAAMAACGSPITEDEARKRLNG